MGEEQAHDRKPSEISQSSTGAATSTSADSALSQTPSSHSSSSLSNRKPTGYTIPDPVSVEEHGRTFNAYREGKYFLPNDALEQERLDMAHEMWRLILDGELSWVPFADEPANVLDIGTGTGIWAIEFAQQHPASHVVGTDLSIIQPPDENIPSNCSFERDDIEEEWVFERGFDYVHLRAMLTCFTNHLGVLQRIYDNLNPGGWVEYHEYDPDVFGRDEKNHSDFLASPLRIWTQRVFSGAKRFGRDMMVARQYKQFLLDAGFVDVTERIVLAPNKPWSEDPREQRIGQYMQANSIDMVEAVSAKLLQGDGMQPDEIQELNAQVRESFIKPDLQLQNRMYIVYGRKPREGEVVESADKQQEVAPAVTPVVIGHDVREGVPASSVASTTHAIERLATTESKLNEITHDEGVEDTAGLTQQKHQENSVLTQLTDATSSEVTSFELRPAVEEVAVNDLDGVVSSLPTKGDEMALEKSSSSVQDNIPLTPDVSWADTAATAQERTQSPPNSTGAELAVTEQTVAATEIPNAELSPKEGISTASNETSPLLSTDLNPTESQVRQDNRPEGIPIHPPVVANSYTDRGIENSPPEVDAEDISGNDFSLGIPDSVPQLKENGENVVSEQTTTDDQSGGNEEHTAPKETELVKLPTALIKEDESVPTVAVQQPLSLDEISQPVRKSLELPRGDAATVQESIQVGTQSPLLDSQPLSNILPAVSPEEAWAGSTTVDGHSVPSHLALATGVQVADEH